MPSLFLPAVALMRRLRFAAKFALVGAVLFLVVLFLGWRAMSALGGRLDQLERERAGVALLADFARWNQVMIDYRQVAITAPSGELHTRLRAQAAQVDAVLAGLERDALAEQARVDSVGGIRELREGWRTLQDGVMALPIDGEFAQKAFALHAREFDRLYKVVHEVGDASGAALDPDITLFYQGFPLFNHTPKAAGITVRILAYQTLNLARGTLTPADRVFYEVTEARLKDSQSGLENMLGQSMRADPEVQQRIAKSLAEFKSQAARLLEFTRTNFIKADRIAVTQYEVERAAAAPIASAWALLEDSRQLYLGQLAARSRAVRLQLWGLAATVAASALVSVWLFVAMYLGIVQSLRRLAGATQALAQGDFSAHVDVGTRDEFHAIADAFNRMVASLSSVIGSVKSSSTQVLEATRQLQSAAERISSGSRTQAEATQTTAATVEEVTVSVDLVADNAQQAVAISSAAAAAAQEGRQHVGAAVAEIDRVAASVQLASTRLEALGAQASKVGAIVNTIQGVADQTNLLALNAAIEAARAGESGRGFAVVADEVRKLAENTRRSTEDIANIVGSLLAGLQSSIQDMGSNRDQVHASVAVTSAATGALERIESGTRSSLERINEIAMASREQSQASQNIARNVERIARMAQDSDDALRSATAATQDLRQLAERLGESVARFRIG